GQRVEVSGIVRAVTPGKTNLDVELALGGYRIHTFPKRPADIDPMNLVGAKVRVKGTVAASFNHNVRHLIKCVLFVPLTNDFTREKMETASPFDDAATPLKGIAQYRRDLAPGKRVHVRGVVTLQRPGEDFFLKDETGGLQIRTRQSD